MELSKYSFAENIHVIFHFYETFSIKLIEHYHINCLISDMQCSSPEVAAAVWQSLAKFAKSPSGKFKCHPGVVKTVTLDSFNRRFKEASSSPLKSDTDTGPTKTSSIQQQNTKPLKRRESPFSLADAVSEPPNSK